MLFEAIQVLAPEALVFVHPCRYEAQGRTPEFDDVLATLDLATDQPRPLEHLQVLRYGVQGHIERLRDFGDACRPPGKASEDRPPRGVGNGAEDVAQFVHSR